MRAASAFRAWREAARLPRGAARLTLLVPLSTPLQKLRHRLLLEAVHSLALPTAFKDLAAASHRHACPVLQAPLP